ncbi:YrrS family protein [Sporosarcina sp. Sa3CUA8]|uniref:YrrS family protein n=2 Tax=Sporosarcina gallistercoris TaxID=2762245 RepID=A0ABR8PFE5_9BACL|nr:YrrS family protein [Sporosarcina gallistercoris]
MLNWMIAIVVLLIVLVGVKILSSDNAPKDKEVAITETTPKEDTSGTETDTEGSDADDKVEDSDQDADADDKDSPKEGTVSDETDEDEDSEDSSEKKDNEKEGTVTYTASEDAVVDETVSNTSWKPIGTSQSGNHVSQYDGSSVDWQEKKKALAYATGMTENDMIFLKIKNGGSPQKSIGIVSSKDKSKKYRVYLEWVDGEGWKPTQMDVLNTLDFNY